MSQPVCVGTVFLYSVTLFLVEKIKIIFIHFCERSIIIIIIILYNYLYINGGKSEGQVLAV